MAGNQGNNRIVWQQWQLDFLNANWERMTAEELSDELGITKTKVREKKYELGFYKLKLEYWTPEQINFLRLNYQEMGDTEMAAEFNKRWHKEKGWSKKHIEKKRRHLHLKRTAAQKKEIHQRNVDNGMFAMCPVKAWKIRGTAAPIGEIRIWDHYGYPLKVIKTEDGFVHYTRWLYEKHNGPVPDNCIVRVKDGNPLNVVLDNLVLISREENATMNSKARKDLQHQKQRTVNRINLQIHKINQLQKNEKQVI